MFVVVYENMNGQIEIIYCDDVEHIFTIMRHHGENSIIHITKGNELQDVTEEAIGLKPFAFLIEL